MGMRNNLVGKGISHRPSIIWWLAFLLTLGLTLLQALLINKIQIPEFVARLIVLLILSLFGYVLATFFTDRFPARKLSNLILLAIQIIVLINVIMAALGIQVTEPKYPVSDNSAVLLSFLGIRIERVFFPLATGINAFGIFAGAASTIAVVSAADDRNSALLRTVFAIFAVMSICVLLLTDSRLSLAAFALLSLAFLLIPKRWFYRLKYLPAFSVLLPFILVLAFRIISATGLLISITRNSSDMITLNSRTIYWGETFRFLSSFTPRHLLGYGFYGHQVSGLIELFQTVTGTVADPTMLHPHNVWLQYWIDSGYLGMLVFFIVHSSLLHRGALLWKEGEKGGIPLSVLAFLSYLVLIGATASVPTMYDPVLFAFFILIGSMLTFVEVGKGKIEMPADYTVDQE